MNLLIILRVYFQLHIVACTNKNIVLHYQYNKVTNNKNNKIIYFTITINH